jgi:hypothetical protein
MKKKIISASLYGMAGEPPDAKYFEGGLAQARAVRDLLLDWELWVYVDESVPREQRRALSGDDPLFSWLLPAELMHATPQTSGQK